MSYIRTYAPVRKTEIGSLVESFMDEFSEHISPSLWEELDVLGRNIDNEVRELEKRIEELEDEE